MHRRQLYFNAVRVDHLSQRFLCSGQRAAGTDSQCSATVQGAGALVPRPLVRRLRHDYNFRPLYRAFHRSGFRLGHDQGDFNAELDEIWNGGDHCRHFGEQPLVTSVAVLATPSHHNGTNSDLLRHRDGTGAYSPQ